MASPVSHFDFRRCLRACRHLLEENDALEWMDVLEASEARYYSAVGYWETVAAICRTLGWPPDQAKARIDTLLHRLEFVIAPIGDRECSLAVDAARDYGRGRHPAALNMGDCFSYACAKSLGATLLYKGGDFARTDLG